MKPTKKTAKKSARRAPAARAADQALQKIADAMSSLVGLADAAAVETARKINERLKQDGTGLWTVGDGSRVQVCDMSDPHVFYALAKAYRGEYPDSYSRKVDIAVLESEALRRLLKGTR